MFVGAKMTTAMLDRLTHHCHIIETGIASHRYRHSSAAAGKHSMAREQARRGKAPPPELPRGNRLSAVGHGASKSPVPGVPLALKSVHCRESGHHPMPP